jgi:hypothetical protein
MMQEISELLLPAIVIQILQSIKELVCHTFDNKKIIHVRSQGIFCPSPLPDGLPPFAPSCPSLLTHAFLFPLFRFLLFNFPLFLFFEFWFGD